MSKRNKELLAGIDIGSKILNVAVRLLTGEVRDMEFDNDAAGHKKLVSLLTKGKRPARVIVEATSLYGLDLCVALDTAGVQVMVINPRFARNFAQAQGLRAKTDRVDARMLLSFLERMEFVRWQRPGDDQLTIRMYARRISALVKLQTAEKNRLHALLATSTVPDAILEDIRAGLEELDKRIASLVEAGVAAIKASPEILAVYEAMTRIKGIGPKSAVAILGELLMLPSDMTTDEVVAHAGLDPKPKETGGPKMGPRSISKVGNSHLRGALWMPVLNAMQHEPAIRAHYEALVAAGKLKMVALVAVARKLLQALWRITRHGAQFDGARFSSRHAKAA